MNKPILLKGAILGAIAVILGALGAHALKNVLTLEQLSSFETAVKYQMYHALAILVLAVVIKDKSSKLLLASVNLFF